MPESGTGTRDPSGAENKKPPSKVTGVSFSAGPLDIFIETIGVKELSVDLDVFDAVPNGFLTMGAGHGGANSDFETIGVMTFKGTGSERFAGVGDPAGDHDRLPVCPFSHSHLSSHLTAKASH